ncbi:hypothetical protein L3Q82_018078, partial [Scortum barcoo]
YLGLWLDSYRYLGLWLDNKLALDNLHTSHLYGKTQSRMYFLRRLQHLQQTPADVLPAGRLCGRHGMKLDSLGDGGRVARTLDKLLMDIMDNASHPLHTVISNQRSLFSERLLLPKCRTNRLKNSFVHHAITLYNSSQGGRRT